MLELRKISKDFGAARSIVHAVRKASLMIQEGEFFSLLGPSGCGKTTLLRLLAGFEFPTSGEIWLEGRRIDEEPAEKRDFNLVFQRYALFPHLNVAENLAFGLEMKGVKPGEIEKRVAEALEWVRLGGYGERKTQTLSGGQQQRVALARAVINRPRVLLLDEPLSALDLQLRRQMQLELLGLQKKLGHSFVFVTHDQEEAMALSNRIAVMNEGRIEQIGSPREIYENPATAFVAKFIGSINSLRGRILADSSGELRVALEEWKGEVTLPKVLGSRPEGSAEVLVRPEKLEWNGKGKNQIRGRVREVIYQGPVCQISISSLSNPESLLLISVPSNSPHLPRGGDEGGVSWDPGEAWVARP